MRNVLISGLALLAAVLATPVCNAIWFVSKTGNWPKVWPAQLESLRSQSRTLHHDGYTMYQIPFTDRAQFEAAWPHFLSIATDDSPVTLSRGHDRWTAVDFDAGVVIFTPNTGQLIVPGDKKTTIYRPEVASAIQDGKLKIPAGTYLKVGPPWPDSIRNASGKLPEYVVADGLEWRATTLEEIRDNRKSRDTVTKTSLCRRARTEIRLIVDGKVVDLNRIQLPNPVIDKRFEKPPNP